MPEIQIHRVILEKTVGKKRQIFVFAFDGDSFPQVVDAIEEMQGKHGFDTIDAAVAMSEAHRRLENG